jgi:hypothetical protein
VVAVLFALALAATGCLGHLEAPFGSEVTELQCSDDRDVRYLSAAGAVADRGIALTDGNPPAAVQLIHDDANEPGFAVIGSSQEGDYQFYILNVPAITEGSMEVVRSSIDEPSGIRLIIELERRQLGSVELDSLAGEITFDVVADDELAGHFEAAFGAPTDQFEGCFHVDVIRTATPSK